MPTDAATSSIVDRSSYISWYHRNRERSRALFDLLTDEAYYGQPIALRHPIVFYDGHLPAFSFNTLVKKGLGGPGIDERLERLFARGIDPADADRSPGALDTCRASTGECHRRNGSIFLQAARRSASIGTRSHSRGTTNVPPTASPCRRFRSNATTSPTMRFSSSSMPADTRTSSGGGRRIGVGFSRNGSRIRRSGNVTTIGSTGAACSSWFRCPSRGRCT